MGSKGGDRFVQGASFSSIITGLIEVGVGIYGALYLSTAQPAYFYAGPVVVGALFILGGYLCWKTKKSGFILSAALGVVIVGGQLAFDGLGPLLDLVVVLSGLATLGFGILGYRSATRTH